MTIGLKYLRVFWLATILVMVGGQLVHAWEELSCVSEHAEHAEDKGSNCAANHECCKTHVQSAMDLVKTSGLTGIKHVFTFSVAADDVAIEGFRQKIKYPPRLS